MSILSELPPAHEPRDEAGGRALVAAAGIGSAALVAALLYWRHMGRPNRQEQGSGPGRPETGSPEDSNAG